MSTDRQAVHLIVSGRVQGVGYRASARREAERRALTGWVRNLPDGRVEAWFEGERAALDGMLAWCAHGPTLARVADVASSWQVPLGLQALEVRHDA